MLCDSFDRGYDCSLCCTEPGWVRKEDEGSGIFTGDSGPNGRPVHFLRDFGRFLLERYQPRGIVVFSAHWETADHMRMVSNWGNESNPLLYDYFGFEPYMYTDVGFKSRGSNELSREVFDAFTGEGMHTHLSGPEEPRGRDGRGFYGAGLDHGVFVPFSVMFPGHTPKDQDAQTFGVPIVQASIDSSSDPKDNEAVGRAVSHLRSKGILVLSGGLTVHTFRDFSAFKEETAKPPFKEWDQAIVDAVNVPTSSKGRQQALLDLVNHPYCRLAHPELEHCELSSFFPSLNCPC